MIRNIACSVFRALQRIVKPEATVIGAQKMVKTLDFEQVKAGLENESLVYLDVRNPSELQTDGKVVGSVNVPLPEFDEAFALDDQAFKAKYGFVKPKPDSKNIVTACLAGRRGAAAAEKLRDKFGFADIMLYPGSFGDWKNKGGPITKG